jgi:hypothetical protein
MSSTTQPWRVQPTASGPAKRKWLRISLVGIGVLALLAVLLPLLLFVLLTSSVPLALPETNVTREDQDALTERWMTFQDALGSKGPTSPFQFSSRDLSVFVSMMPRLRSRVYGSFEGNKLRAQFSMPLRVVSLNRYVNGTATVQAALKNGDLKIEVTSCRVNGHPLPRWICRQLGRKTLNPEAFWIMQRFDVPRRLRSIDVRDSTLFLTPRTSE